MNFIPSDDGQDSNKTEKTDAWTRHYKFAQLHCFFQILAHSLDNDRVITPFHSMLGHLLYCVILEVGMSLSRSTL